METAFELGRRAALIKLAQEGVGMNLGARPAAPAAPPTPPASVSMKMTMPKPPAPAPAPGGGMMGGIGQHVQNFFRNPTNMAQMIGASGNIGKGVLGAVGAPGLFAISNLARGGGEMGSILRGGIPTGGGVAGPPGAA